MEQVIDKEQRIRDLNAELASTDYRVLKCVEAQTLGLPAPYDMKTVHAERQAIRDEINSLQETDNE